MKRGRLTHGLVPLLSLLMPGGAAFSQELTVPVAEAFQIDSAIILTQDSVILGDSIAFSLDDAVLLREAALQLDSTLLMEVPLDSALVGDTILVEDSLRLDFLSDVVGRFKGEDFTPEPIRAMWLAIAFPGGGQIYNRKFWKLPMFYGGYLGCMYALTWNNLMLRDYSQAYLDIMDDDPDTKSYEDMLPLGYDITGKEERFKTIFKNKKDRYRKFRDLSVFAFIGVYALSIVDAYVDAELSTFDISRDLSLHFEPAVINLAPSYALHNEKKAYGLQVNLNF